MSIATQCMFLNICEIKINIRGLLIPFKCSDSDYILGHNKNLEKVNRRPKNYFQDTVLFELLIEKQNPFEDFSYFLTFFKIQEAFLCRKYELHCVIQYIRMDWSVLCQNLSYLFFLPPFFHYWEWSYIPLVTFKKMT